MTLDVVANTELLDEFAVFEDVAVLDVDEQATTLTNEHEQTAARMVILGVLFEVLGEVADALGEDSHLHLGAAGVSLALAEFLDELGSALLRDAELVRHACSTFRASARAPAFMRRRPPDGCAFRCAPLWVGMRWACGPSGKCLRFRSRPIVCEGAVRGKRPNWRATGCAQRRQDEAGARCTLGPWGIQMVNEVRPASLVA